MRKIQAILGLTAAVLALAACSKKEQIIDNRPKPPIDISKAKNGDVIPNQYLVALKNTSGLASQSVSAQAAQVSSQMSALANQYDLDILRKATALNMMTVRASAADIALLEKDPNVRMVAPNHIWKMDKKDRLSDGLVASKIKQGFEAAAVTLPSGPNNPRLDLNTINVARDGVRTASSVSIIFTGSGVYGQQYNLAGKNFDVPANTSCVEEWAYFGLTLYPNITWWNDGINDTTRYAGLATSYYNPAAPVNAASASSDSGPDFVNGRYVYSAAPAATVTVVPTEMDSVTTDDWQICGINHAVSIRQRGKPTILLMSNFDERVGYDVDPRDEDGNSYKGTMTKDFVLMALHDAKVANLISVAPGPDLGDTNAAESRPGGYGYGMDGNNRTGAVITIGAFATGGRDQVLNPDGKTHQRTYNTSYGHRIDFMAPGGTHCYRDTRNADIGDLNNAEPGCLLPTTASEMSYNNPTHAAYDYVEGSEAAAAIAAGVFARVVATDFSAKVPAECGSAWSQDGLVCLMRNESRKATSQFGPLHETIHDYGSPMWAGAVQPVTPPVDSIDAMPMNPDCDYTYPYDYTGPDDGAKNQKKCVFLYDNIFLPDGY